MESFTWNLSFAQKAAFNSTLMVCLIISFGLCTVLLPTLTSDTADGWASSSDLVYIVNRSFLVANVLLVIILMLHLIFNKSHYHRTQKIFWPLRCHHCSRVVASRNDRGSRDLCESRSLGEPPPPFLVNDAFPTRYESRDASFARRQRSRNSSVAVRIYRTRLLPMNHSPDQRTSYHILLGGCRLDVYKFQIQRKD